MRASLVVIAGIVLIGGSADRRIGGSRIRANPGRSIAQRQEASRTADPPNRRSAVPEFVALAHLLHERQGLELPDSSGPDLPSPGLTHYQRFPSAVFEEHSDGTVYSAHFPSHTPEWYDVTRAEDLAGPPSQAIRAGRGRKTFGDLLRSNVRESRWPAYAQAFPAGLAPAPHWFSFALPLSDPCSADRHRLADLEKLLREEPATRLARLLWEAEKPVRRL